MVKDGDDFPLYGTTSSANFDCYSPAELVETLVFSDRIELVYKERSNITCGNGLGNPFNGSERVFKQVFSCVEGKWHESERIYGTIVTPSEERYIFD